MDESHIEEVKIPKCSKIDSAMNELFVLIDRARNVDPGLAVNLHWWLREHLKEISVDYAYASELRGLPLDEIKELGERRVTRQLEAATQPYIEINDCDDIYPSRIRARLVILG